MTSGSMPIVISPEARLNSRLVSTLSSERLVLSALFILMLVAYGAIGRDALFNRLYMTKTTINDPIGAVLPYVRVATCFASIVLISATAGVNWAFSKIPYYFAPVAALAFASCLWADETKDAARNALVMSSLWVALPILMFRMGILLVVQNCLYLIAWIMILSFGVAVLFPHIGVHDGLELTQNVHVGRWRGIFAHKNMLGPWAAYGSVFLFTHSWLCNGNKMFFWVARVCALVCLYMAGSATGVVASFSLVAFHFMFVSLRRYGMATTLMGVVCAALVASIVVFGGGSDTLFNLLGRDSTFTGRAGLWEIAWEYVWQNPLFGSGYQMLGGNAMADRIIAVYGQRLGPESGYLTLLLDLGFVGAVLFAIPNLIAVRNGFEWMPFVTPRERACIEFLLSIMFVAFVEAFTEANILICTGFDGVVSFCSFFGLMALPKSPVSLFRSEFRMAKNAIPGAEDSRRARPAEAMRHGFQS